MHQIKSEINIVESLENFKGEFIIPIYQRRYAWKESEVEQLINDLYESDKKYYIGNIVVEKIANNKYSVIDGQQRLTTLYLIGLVCKGKINFNLSYNIREEDNNFLEDIAKENSFDEAKIDEIYKKHRADEQLSSNLKTIIKHMNKLEKALKNVKFAFTVLDKDEVDIAKYFEVMNSRGKQLEHHQILKAKFLKHLNEEDRDTYASLWDYCSRMNAYIEDFIYTYEKRTYDRDKKQNRYEIGRGKLRSLLINYVKNHPKTSNINDFFKNGKNESGFKEIIELLKEESQKSEDEKRGVDEYRSFIKFEYFLLHVLRLYLKTLKEKTLNDEDVVFKDTKLLEQFEKYLPWLKDKDEEKGNGEQAKKFLHLLFRYRILFDYFFFKRYKNTDEPFVAKLTMGGNEIEIKRLPGENDEKSKNYEKLFHSILNLQLLFNFTTDFFAQYWIQSAFIWLDGNLENFSDTDFYTDFKNFLENFDNKIMAQRLSIDEEQLKSSFLNHSEDNSTNKKIFINENILKSKLNQGTRTPHYWFYKLDYLLWKGYDWEKSKFNFPFDETEKFKYEKIKQKFRLSRLNSIEHIFPQSKKNDFEQNSECKIDNFGNLALISNHLNSALIDELFENKRTIIQKQLNNGTIESLKLLLVYSKYEEWNAKNCKNHEEEITKILLDNFTANI